MNDIYDLTHDGATGAWYVQKIDFLNDVETLEFPSYADAIKWIKAAARADKVTIV